jgi:HSP20 family protein
MAPSRVIDQLFADAFDPNTPLVRGVHRPLDFMPIDVHREGKELRIEASLPGFTAEDVTVTAEPGRLVIEAQREGETEHKDESCVRHERYAGRMYREIPLPQDADPENASATFEQGVLHITVPLPNAPEPKRISVQAPTSTTSGDQGEGEEATAEVSGQSMRREKAGRASA